MRFLSNGLRVNRNQLIIDMLAKAHNRASVDVSAKEGDASKMHRAATNITELYAPQFEQFGPELSAKGRRLYRRGSK